MAASFAFIPFRMDITRAGWVQGLKTCATLNAKPLVAIYMALVAIYMALVRPLPKPLIPKPLQDPNLNLHLRPLSKP